MNQYNTCFNIAAINSESYIYGPGKRFVIWVQGCSLQCPECWNEDMHCFNPRKLIERDELFKKILCTDNIDGITILGGEPLDQPNNLLWFLETLHNTGVHIMLYTGYELEEIKTNPLFEQICSYADILIPGRYQKEKRDLKLKWRGSQNQQIISKEILNIDECNQVEIIIDEFGKVTYYGYPDLFL